MRESATIDTAIDFTASRRSNSAAVPTHVQPKKAIRKKLLGRDLLTANAWIASNSEMLTSSNRRFRKSISLATSGSPLF